MAASSSKDIQSQIRDDLLQCPICFSQFSNPRMLRCQHTFCLRCLKGCLKTSKETFIKCAVCRKVTHLGQNGVDDIPANLSISALLQMVKKSNSSSDKLSESKIKGKAQSSKLRHSANRGRGVTIGRQRGHTASRGRGRQSANRGRGKNNQKTKPADKNANHRMKQKYDSSDEEELRRVYRREYTPVSVYSSSSSGSEESYCSCGDSECEGCYGCNTDDSSSSSSCCSCRSSSVDDDSDFSLPTPEIRKMTVRRNGGGGRCSCAHGCCSGNGKPKSWNRR